MVSKCANPGCSAPFHYLRDGKVFRIEMEHGNRAEPRLVHPARTTARLEHFWLCGACSGAMTLIVEEGKVVAVPLHPEPLRRAAAS